MPFPFVICFGMFGLVMLTVSAQLFWPSFFLFGLSLLFAVNHVAMAFGMTYKFQKGANGGDSKLHARNTGLSFLSLGIALLGLLLHRGGTTEGEIPGNDGKESELVVEPQLIGAADNGVQENEVVPGGNGSGDGFDQVGASKEMGGPMGSGEEEHGVDATEQLEDPEELDEQEPAQVEELEAMPPEKEPEKPKTKEEEGEEVFVSIKPKTFSLSFDPSAPAPTLKKKPSRAPVRGGSSAYGTIASVDASGAVVKPDRDTSILIFFDASGSMKSTFKPLQEMRNSLLLKALLPCYGTIKQYKKKVKVISARGEDYFDWLKQGLHEEKSVVFIFQDESDGNYYYHGNSKPAPDFFLDITHIRNAIQKFEGSYFRGIVFQVRNRKEEDRFQTFLKRTFKTPPFGKTTIDELAQADGRNSPADYFLKSNPYAKGTLLHVADYFRRSGPISFDVKTNIPAGGLPQYYLYRITAAARELGIDLSG